MLVFVHSSDISIILRVGEFGLELRVEVGVGGCGLEGELHWR
jgi:hypothetical protein